MFVDPFLILKYLDLNTEKLLKSTTTVYVVYLAVILIWRFGDFCSSAKLKEHQYNFIAIICIAATAFCQIKVTPTMITDQFDKYSTRQ